MASSRTACFDSQGMCRFSASTLNPATRLYRLQTLPACLPWCGSRNPSSETVAGGKRACCERPRLACPSCETVSPFKVSHDQGNPEIINNPSAGMPKPVVESSGVSPSLTQDKKRKRQHSVDWLLTGQMRPKVNCRKPWSVRRPKSYASGG